jgi:flavin reductase
MEAQTPVQLDTDLPDAQTAASLRDSFTRCMREVPGAIAIIASAHGGERRGMAATSWCSLSADPPSMLVCVNRTASPHDFIAKSGCFSINQLALDHGEIVSIFSGKRGLNGEQRFVHGEWCKGRGGMPLLGSAITSFECEVTEQHQYHTHSIFLGRVIDLHNRLGAQPLVYHNGTFSRATAIA